MSKIKVLTISPNGFLGGAERFVYETAKIHKNLGNIEHRILFLNNGTCYDLCNKEGIDTYLLPFKLRLSNPFSLIKFLIYLYSLRSKYFFNIAHTTMPYSQVLIALYKFFFPFAQFKTTWYQHGPVGGILDRIAVLTSVDRIFFNTDFLMKEHNKIPLALWHKSKELVVPIGVPIPANIPRTLSLNIENKTLIKNSDVVSIALIGRICEWKGHFTFLKSIHFLKKNNYNLSQFQFIIVGSPNSDADKLYLKKLLEFQAEYDLINDVHFLGHTNNIQSIYSYIDLLLNLSTTPEPFGLTIAEAMANEVLILGGVRGGITDLITSDLTGFTLDTQKEDAYLDLANSMICIKDKILNNAAELNEIRAHAKNLIKTKYDPIENVRTLEKIYTELIKKESPK